VRQNGRSLFAATEEKGGSDNGVEDDVPRAVDEPGDDDHVVAAGVAGSG